MSTNDLLQKLRKLLSETADTTEYREPWQELFSREFSIPSRSIRAAEAVRGFAGSWAASYSIYDGFDKNNSGNVTPVSGFDYQLGKRGYPEINFVPYDWNTNRFGRKGPSLVGHPVSFEVVGATHKTYEHDNADLKFPKESRILPQSRPPAEEMPEFSVDLVKNQITVGTADIQSLYGNFDTSIPTWVLFTEMGGSFTDHSRQAGSNANEDRPYTAASKTGLVENPKYEGVARYELFRVQTKRGKTLQLLSNKPLSEYFYGFDYSDPVGEESPTTVGAKSIMLLQPKVARLAALKDSDGKSFAVLPPERTAVGEFQLPYKRHISFDGLAEDYNKGVLTPNPKPIPIQTQVKSFSDTSADTYRGEFLSKIVNPFSGDGDIPNNRFRLAPDNADILDIISEGIDDGGLLIHVQEVIHSDKEGVSKNHHTHRYADFTGYFEIVGTGKGEEQTADYLECRYLTTCDPETGRPQASIRWWLPDTEQDERLIHDVQLRCTLHRPVKHIHDTYNKRGYADDVEAARITGIIDPNEVGRSVKVHGTNDVPMGGYAGRADRSIPNTQSLSDPGSLLDLGFRMVFYTLSEVRIMQEYGKSEVELNLPSRDPFTVAEATQLMAAKLAVYSKEYNELVAKDTEIKESGSKAKHLSLSDKMRFNLLVAALNEINPDFNLKPYNSIDIIPPMSAKTIAVAQMKLASTGFLEGENPYLKTVSAIDKAIVDGGLERWINWERPVASNEAILDPEITDEKQYIDVDYAAGVVKFSHTPKPNGDFVLDGNGNAIVFASFVPYSMEGGQRSTGVRLTGGDIRSANLGYPKSIQRDVFGKEKVYPTTKTTNLKWGGDLTLRLGDENGFIDSLGGAVKEVKGYNPSHYYEMVDIPSSGYFSLLVDAKGAPKDGNIEGDEFSRWDIAEKIPPQFSNLQVGDTHSSPINERLFAYDGYTVDSENNEVTLHNVRSNILDTAAVFSVGTANDVYNEGNPVTYGGAVFRKRPDIKSFYDRNYGSSARTDSIRFAYADITYNEDGSMTVLPTAVAGPAVELRAFYPFGDDQNPTEIGRFHLDPRTQRWTTDDPPWYRSSAADSPKKVNEIGLEVSRGRLYTNWKFEPTNTLDVAPVMGKVYSLDDGIRNNRDVKGHFQVTLVSDPSQPDLASLLVWKEEQATERLSIQLDRVTIAGASLGTMSPKSGSLVGDATDPIAPKAGEGPVRFAFGYDYGTLLPSRVDNVGRREYDGDDLLVSMLEIKEGDSVTRKNVVTDKVFYVIDGNLQAFVRPDSATVEGLATFSGRQVFAFPQRSYAVSRKFEYPVEVPSANLPWHISLRHVNQNSPSLQLGASHGREALPKPSWLNVELNVQGGGVADTPEELAKILNDNYLYGKSLSYFENAGFLKEEGAPSGRPEHCLVFVSAADPRFPATADKDCVALIYSGYGRTGGDVFAADDQQIIHHTEQSGLGIICDITSTPADPGHPAANPDISYFSLGSFLGGDFQGDSRIGGLNVPRDTERSHGSCNFFGNGLLGYSESGTRPVGRYLGEFNIKDVNPIVYMDDGVEVPAVKLGLTLPTGMNSDWYNDLTAVGDLKDINTSTNERWLGRLNWDYHYRGNPNLDGVPDFIINGQSVDPYSYYNQSEMLLSHGTSPYGGLVGSRSGILCITALFGLSEENESNSHGYRQYASHLYYAKINEKTDWVAPKNLWDEIAYGDLVSAKQKLSGDEDIEMPPRTLQGRVFSKSEDASWLTFLARNKDSYKTDKLTLLNAFASDSQATKFSKGNENLIRGKISHPVYYPTLISVTPSVESGTNAAVAHFFDNFYTFNGIKAVSDGTNQEEQAFTGGGALSTQHKSAVFMGAGRVSLLSTYGNFEPTGISLHNLLANQLVEKQFSKQGLGRPTHTTPVKTSTYIESGAFTTFVGGGGSSRGLYQEYNQEHIRAGYVQRSEEFEGGLFESEYPSVLPKKDELKYGGVGGLRISGDAHLWLENIAPVSGADARIAKISGDRKSAVNGLGSRRAHLPTHFTTKLPGKQHHFAEYTIVLGLNQSDWGAIKGWAVGGEKLIGETYELAGGYFEFEALGFRTSDGLRLHKGEQMLRIGQAVSSTDIPLLMPSLVGNYIDLRPNTKTHFVGRIVGAPVIKESRHAGDLSLDDWYEGLPTGSGEPYRSKMTDKGRHSESKFVALMAIRIEVIEQAVNPLSSYYGETRFRWGLYQDLGMERPIYSGDVVDPGGSPTGVRSSLRGLTLDPQIVAGRSYLPAQVIPFVDADDYKLSLAGLSGLGNNANLLGVHDQVDIYGKHFSRAFFSVSKGGKLTDFRSIETDDEYIRRYNALPLLPKRARLVVLSEGLTTDLPQQELHKTLSSGSNTGRSDFFGYPRRLGPGVIMDGGLGLVQANAFRARPRPQYTESLGNLTVFGKGAYPLPNLLYKGNIGSELPSVFNTSEFYGEVSVANPQSRIVIESPNAAEGLVANMLASEFMTKRHRGPTHISHYVHKHDLFSAVLNLDYYENISASVDVTQFGTVGQEYPIVRSPVFGDTIFPQVSSGIVFRSPGTAVYERAFRSTDATGSNPYRKANEGTHNRSGIPGMGVPFNGEVLLLPQGPSEHYRVDVDSNIQTTQTPLDAPLYDFVNSPPESQIVDKFVVPKSQLSHSRFGVSLMDVFRDVETALPTSELEDGVDNHWGQPGLVQQSYRHSLSREDSKVYKKNISLIQARLLDGMVLEDVTNGTFYTVGSVGRDFYRNNVLSGLGVPGDGERRSSVNGSLTVGGRNRVGRTIGDADYQVETLPEVLYDIGPLANLGLGYANLEFGLGDRGDYDLQSDKVKVRRPLSGHRFRITPNVEFVPVLGPRGVKGGLMPPVAFVKRGDEFKNYWPETLDGDALFYDINHVFKKSDLGKMLYICGTGNYAHTGWYTIIEVLLPSDNLNDQNTQESSLYYRPHINCPMSSGVILRRNNWGERAKEVPLSQNRELANRKNFLQEPSTKVFPLSNFDSGGVHYLYSTGDQFANAQPFNELEGYGHFVPKSSSTGKMCGNFKLIVTDFTGETINHKIDKGELIAVASTAADAAVKLNKDTRSNGQEDSFLRSGKVGTATDYDQWIFWEERSGCLAAKIVPSRSYKKLIQGHRATVQILWQTRGYDDDDTASGPSFIGFGFCEGHNLGQVNICGDSNNAGFRAYRNPDVKSGALYVEGPAAGLRWVFSHPLTEENVGSYVHLTRTPIYRFGQILESQKTNVDSMGFSYYDAHWTSGHPLKTDVRSITWDGEFTPNFHKDGIDLKTDIFRINRCPNTGKIIIGGDCEVYYPEFNFTDPNKYAKDQKNELGVTDKYNQPVVYSPIGIHGNWPNSIHGGTPQEQEQIPSNRMLGTRYSLNYPTEYYLQPIAREKIVTVSPSNASSSMMFSRGLSDKLGVPQGPQGVGAGAIIGHGHPASPTSAFAASPWQLVSRADLTKTTMAQSQSRSFDSRVELNNANLNLVNVKELLNFAKKQAAELDAVVEKISDDVSASSQEISELEQRIAKLTGALAALAEAYEEAQGRVNELYETAEGTQLRDLEFILKTLINLLTSGLPAAVREVSRKIATVMEDYEEADVVTAQLTKLTLYATNRIEATRLLTEEMQEEFEKVKQETDRMREEKRDKEDLRAITLKEKAELIKNLSQYDYNLDWEADDPFVENGEGDVAQLVAKIKALSQRAYALKGVITDLSFRIGKNETDIAELQESLGENIGLIEELKRQLEEDSAKLKVAQAESHRLEVLLGSDLSPDARLEKVQSDVSNFESEDIEDLPSVIAAYVAKAVDNESLRLLIVKEVLQILLAEYVRDKIGAYEEDIQDKRNEIGMSDLLANRDTIQATREQNLAELDAYLQETKEERSHLALLKEEQTYEENRKKFHKERVEYWQEAADYIEQNKLDPMIASESDYIWTPAGEWWQLYQPAWDEFGPDASAPPPTLRVDITDTFTQAIGPGSGLNTPHPNRFPRGVRLNRLWVNFGVWGNETNKALDNSCLPGMPEGVVTGNQQKNMVLDEMYICFNLILDIPGSQARVKNGNQRLHRPYSGNEAFPMGGRMPTASYNHPDNKDEMYPGGTIVVPLYVNREAGDMMPNVMERFVTSGPRSHKEPLGQFSINTRDWSGGDYEHGFGSSHETPYDYSFYLHSAPVQNWGTSANSNRDKDIALSMFANSFNPVVWGGMDFARYEDGGVWVQPKYAAVQASIFPRSSVLGGGLRSAFTSGLVPDGSVFSDYDPHSLSAATLTGITIAHSGQMPAPPSAEDGSYSNRNKRGGQTCPHGFTLALTPVGDAFTYPRNFGAYKPYTRPVNSLKDPNSPLHYGRKLDNPISSFDESKSNNHPGQSAALSLQKPFKVGNWLEQITQHYGIYSPSGSMLPPGSRVYLEVSVGPGPAAKDQDPTSKIGAGAWVGSIKLGFDVETVDGTAWTADVNVLGDEEG